MDQIKANLKVLKVHKLTHHIQWVILAQKDLKAKTNPYQRDRLGWIPKNNMLRSYVCQSYITHTKWISIYRSEMDPYVEPTQDNYQPLLFQTLQNIHDDEEKWSWNQKEKKGQLCGYHYKFIYCMKLINERVPNPSDIYIYIYSRLSLPNRSNSVCEKERKSDMPRIWKWLLFPTNFLPHLVFYFHTLPLWPHSIIFVWKPFTSGLLIRVMLSSSHAKLRSHLFKKNIINQGNLKSKLYLITFIIVIY